MSKTRLATSLQRGGLVSRGVDMGKKGWRPKTGVPKIIENAGGVPFGYIKGLRKIIELRFRKRVRHLLKKPLPPVVSSGGCQLLYPLAEEKGNQSAALFECILFNSYSKGVI